MPLPTADPGLCLKCIHARQVASDRGSGFWLCRKGLTDPRFPKYPRLPVLSCDGYLRADEERERRGSGDAAGED